jgi:hypothetical protein
MVTEGNGMKPERNYARVSTIRFKPGRREEGIKVLEWYFRKGAAGSTGHLVLVSVDDPDEVTYVTLWSSEETMISSLRIDIGQVHRSLVDLIEEPADRKHHKVHEHQVRNVVSVKLP